MITLLITRENVIKIKITNYISKYNFSWKSDFTIKNSFFKGMKEKTLEKASWKHLIFNFTKNKKNNTDQRVYTGSQTSAILYMPGPLDLLANSLSISTHIRTASLRSTSLSARHAINIFEEFT